MAFRRKAWRSIHTLFSIWNNGWVIGNTLNLWTAAALFPSFLLLWGKIITHKCKSILYVVGYGSVTYFPLNMAPIVFLILSSLIIWVYHRALFPFADLPGFNSRPRRTVEETKVQNETTNDQSSTNNQKTSPKRTGDQSHQIDEQLSNSRSAH